MFLNEKMYDTKLVDLENIFKEIKSLDQWELTSYTGKILINKLESTIKSKFNLELVRIIIKNIEPDIPVIETIITENDKKRIRDDVLYDYSKNKKDLMKDFILFINTFSLNLFNNKELVAITLHELGHLKSYGKYRSIIKKYAYENDYIYNKKSFNKIKLEFHADNYAVRYHYKEELISVFNKLDGYKILRHRTDRINNINKTLKYEGLI